ncbi:hypothetical protein PIB30_117042 [Stylosanthes scabra]|uniref:Uncharacterized protein n=1 Tax=Stylosanthes scabra TaxID=79078 RepID=A0ABU6WUJ3_9FABA|nr:hypothetical protein [Stylosanthes scabra]
MLLKEESPTFRSCAALTKLRSPPSSSFAAPPRRRCISAASPILNSQARLSGAPCRSEGASNSAFSNWVQSASSHFEFGLLESSDPIHHFPLLSYVLFASPATGPVARAAINHQPCLQIETDKRFLAKAPKLLSRLTRGSRYFNSNMPTWVLVLLHPHCK